MTPAFYFITHPNVVIDPQLPVPRWPLSERGRERMRLGLCQPWVAGLGAVYCSTEQKSIDAAQILAAHRGLDVVQVPALGENDRSATGYRPPPEFERLADRFFAEPQRSVEGWETAADAQARIVAAVADIAQAHRDDSALARQADPALGATTHSPGRPERRPGAVAIVSHGAVGTLLYCHLSGAAIDRRWDQPANGGGNYFAFSLLPPGVHGWWQAIDVTMGDGVRPIPCI